jgi:BCD family chlorophyll transporter-like MFS transporter
MQETRKLKHVWLSWGMRLLPFTDAVSEDLPLSRLLRLSLFQMSVGMALVLLVGTLNRVMIVELGVPTSLVAVMVGMPLLFAPFRALIGFRSDHHRSQLGWRRVPYIWMGTLLQFGGFAIMPFALLVLGGLGESSQAPVWVGQLATAVAFLLVGAGLHTTQTAGLALATDLTPPEKQANVVGFMYVMMLLGMLFSALWFGDLLTDFTPGRLVQVVQAAALITLVLNTVAMWKQESRSRDRKPGQGRDPSFIEAWQLFTRDAEAVRRLWVVALGTLAFSMEDVLLEPYGGEILHLSVASTTQLTATLALGGLVGFASASRLLSRGADPFRMAWAGCLFGLPAFMLVIGAAFAPDPWLWFSAGTLLIGLGAGLFGHGTLTATMNRARTEQAGLAMGAWGAAQATAAGLAMALGGILRDVVASMSSAWTGYCFVYSIEWLLLVATLWLMRPLMRAPILHATRAPLN